MQYTLQPLDIDEILDAFEVGGTYRGVPLRTFCHDLLNPRSLAMDPVMASECGVIELEFMAPLMHHRPERPFVMADIKRHRLMPRSRVVHH